MASATSTWQPQEAGLVQLCNLFSVLQKGENQAQILQQLEQYKQYPDFNNYLAYIFATAEQVPLEVRQSAGLYLKNSLKQQYDKTAQQLKEYLKGSLVPMLAHPQKALRHTAGSCISTMVTATGLSEWPQLVPLLQQCLQTDARGPQAAAVDGGLDALYKIVEESPVQMEATMRIPPGSDIPHGPDGEGTTSASMLLVPPLLQLLQIATDTPQSGHLKKQAAAVLNLMALNMPAGISHNLDLYLQSLFALALDANIAVRQEVVKGMVQLLAVQPDKLQPYLYQVIEYMLQCNEADDEGLALESCEFWMAFCEASLDQELLRPFLPRLIPMLMKNMVFNEDDEEVQEAQEAEAAAAAHQPERASELKPVHHKQSGRHGGAGVDDDDDDDEALGRWNLRKCSAAGLDRLSVVYGDKLLPELMPIVQTRLQEADWRSRESAILALGAVAEGCHMGLLPFLGGMVDMLLPKLADPQPMVRIISCWALGRYSYWLLSGAQESAAEANKAAAGQAGTPKSQLHVQLGQVVQGLLRGVLDRNKFVQDAACSAVAILCQTAGQEDAGHMLAPYVQDLVQVLSTAVKEYGKRNLHLACDALCMLGEALGPSLREPQLASVFMPALCERLARLGPHDKELISIMEALISAAGVLGRVADPWAPSIWTAAMQIVVVHAQLHAATPAGQQSQAAKGVPEYDADLHALALDMLSALVEALGSSVGPLVAGSPLVQLILSGCQDPNPDVRQSSFALVGDLSRAFVESLVPVVPQLVAAAVAALAPGHIHDDTIRACNNACWSLGELAIKLQPAQVGVWAGGVAERMADLLAAGPRHLPQSLIENAAITLGRVAWQAPEQLAPHLAHFCVPWCHALRHVRDDVEKEQAFFGLFALLSRNPDPVLLPGQPFAALIMALVSWRVLKGPTLQQELKQVVQGLQARMQAAGSWQVAVQQLEPAVQQKLSMMFAA